MEDISTPDHRVHSGRTLHDAEVDKRREWQSLELSSDAWGIRGKVDFARYRDRQLVAVEHKKGRSKGDDAWDSDKLQVTAYAALLAEHFGRPVPEGRIRYHAGLQLAVRDSDGRERKFPGMDVGAVILHGSAQITSQAIHFAAANDIAVHWISGGWYVGGIAPPAGAQRRLRQYRALQDDGLRLRLARRLAIAKVENQLRFIARHSRARDARDEARKFLIAIRGQLRGVRRCAGADALRGFEGIAARNYFLALAVLVDPGEKLMAFSGRSRRPPRDGFNAALSFGYGLLYREVMGAILAVGLDSTVEFFHAPRTAAHPLALDLMELFRTTLWDMPLVASTNRRQWKEDHLAVSRKQVWLSDEGKRLAARLFEQRKQETWKHPVLNYSSSYARAIELETRLLEKEWSGEEGLFARMRLRG